MLYNFIFYFVSIWSVIFFIGSVQFKEKKNILLMQTFASMFYAVSYFMLGAYSGFVTEIIEQCKDLVFYKYEKNNLNIPFIFLIIFVIGLIVVAVVTYNGFYTLMPLVINLMYFISSYFKNPKYIRIVMIIGAILWIYYNFSVGAFVIIIGNVFEIISASISLVRFRDKVK